MNDHILTSSLGEDQIESILAHYDEEIKRKACFQTKNDKNESEVSSSGHDDLYLHSIMLPFVIFRSDKTEAEVMKSRYELVHTGRPEDNIALINER